MKLHHHCLSIKQAFEVEIEWQESDTKSQIVKPKVFQSSLHNCSRISLPTLIIYHIVHIVTISGNDGVLNLMDLPTEVIELGLFPYLKHVELKRMKLNRRLTGIAHSVMEKRYRKCKLLGNVSHVM